MNREEVKKLLGEGATDAQISAVLDKFHSEQSSLKEQINTLQNKVTVVEQNNTELLGYKTKVEEIEKANMTKEQQIELERKQLAEKTKAISKLQNSIKAKSILIGVGIGEEEADGLVASIVKEDEQATLASAQLLANQFNSIKEATAKQTREELANLNVKPTPSNVKPTSNPMNWEQFSQLSQEEQAKFIEENPDEFSKL